MRALLASSIVILLVPPAFAQTLFSRMVSENNLLLHKVSFSEDCEAGAFGMEGYEEQLLCTCGPGPAPGSLPMGQVVSSWTYSYIFLSHSQKDVENCLFSSYEK